MTVLTGVRKRYRMRGPWVLDGIDLELPPGVLVRVLGGNGTGKSTLLRLAAGIGRPTRGRVTGRQATGYVPERFPPALPLTALDYLLHLGRIHGLDTRQARQRALDLLDRFEAAGFAGTPLRELSKGTAQKVAVAQALLPRPGLLVLDEAWTGLDAHARALLDAEVDARLADAGAVLFVDHDPDRLADRPARCFALDDGRLVPVAGPPPGSDVQPGSGVPPGPELPVSPPVHGGETAVPANAGRAVPVAELELSGLPAADPGGVGAL
ncbi:MAG TPA: ABC transporter ATP-binding protein, partial [Kineosporiaceae bacterium]|nr:ABC transporter ATP-binding protein [Kineosporiaceae bacterium]